MKDNFMLLSEFQNIIEGKLIRDGEFDTLEYCTSNCNIAFLTFLENPKYLNELNEKISCVITTEEISKKTPQHIKGIIIADEPRKEFVKLHNFLTDSKVSAIPEFKTEIGENCDISPLALIAEKNVRIGDNVSIGPFTVINNNVFIGDRCKIYEHCVIGGKGFNYVRTNEGEILGMRDMGKIVIEDDVEIYPMCHIAKGPLLTDITRIGKKSKIDALVYIGHGMKIGERSEILAGAQIGGNCVIGDESWIGINATIANRIQIGDNGRVSLGAVVTKNVDMGQTVSGNFAVDHNRFLSELKEANEKAKLRK